MDKRKESEFPQNGHVVKRPRVEDVTLVSEEDTLSRTSDLIAPNLQMLGHSSEVLVSRFDTSGSKFASGGMDRQILLWNVFGEVSNFGILSGAKGAITDLQWSRDGEVLYNACSDTNLYSWNTNSGQKIRKYKGHAGVVNALDVLRVGSELLASVSDDSTLKVWDSRSRDCIQSIGEKFPLTAVAISQQGTTVYTGGIEGVIKAWDLRTNEVLYTLTEHNDIITSLSLSKDGSTLLSNSMDSTVRTFDVKPFAPSNRHISVYSGAVHGLEHNLLGAAWSGDTRLIAAGSSDRNTYVWSSSSGELKYQLPGHEGCVNHVDFHPTQNIILSCSSDKTMFLGELS
ncbi:splicing factor Spf38 [Schizosaccharomyces octosporus yFS286]|uniref:Splicing factor Spf38 n=1 Tax=Schizosaccharomyces octosporus (strain yFS286) TaxID=483514 RepID=S9PW80_SCHOY|nr:splicing factor Spf38 [Schizosaccharomyces octosporus yFS286]EPX73361.1 splicing factor Spf38 [Schizosaccharomyces octosporus yFS286]